MSTKGMGWAPLVVPYLILLPGARREGGLMFAILASSLV
jgi:hypothetical protein